MHWQKITSTFCILFWYFCAHFFALKIMLKSPIYCKCKKKSNHFLVLSRKSEKYFYALWVLFALLSMKGVQSQSVLILHFIHHTSYVVSVQKDLWKFCEIQSALCQCCHTEVVCNKSCYIKRESRFNVSFNPYQLNNRPVYLWQGKWQCNVRLKKVQTSPKA